MSSLVPEANENSGVPPFVLNQQLIYRMKQRLNLASLNSSFVSKNQIIDYIKLFHDENQQIRKALDPLSIQDQIVSMRTKCEILREEVGKKEGDIWKITEQLHKLDQDLHFMDQHCEKEQQECDLIEAEIKAMIELHFADRSAPEPEQVSFLMDNFFKYFEQQREPDKEQGQQLMLLENSAKFGKGLSEKQRSISKLENKIIETGQISQIDLEKITYTGEEEIQYEKKN